MRDFEKINIKLINTARELEKIAEKIRNNATVLECEKCGEKIECHEEEVWEEHGLCLDCAYKEFK